MDSSKIFIGLADWLRIDGLVMDWQIDIGLADLRGIDRLAWIGVIFLNWLRSGNGLMYWSRIGIVLADWSRIGNGLVLDFKIGLGLAID